MKEIFERRSIRKYTEKQISDEQIKEILKAAMSAPSAGNQQPWNFIVIRDKKTFDEIQNFHPYAKMLKEASAGIVVCGDLDKELHPGYWIQDCSAATENMLIEIQHLGLGAVWLGIYPREERVKGIKRLLNIPERVMPLALISIGYPDEKKEPSVKRFDQSRIHLEKW